MCKYDLFLYEKCTNKLKISKNCLCISAERHTKFIAFIKLIIFSILYVLYHLLGCQVLFISVQNYFKNDKL